MLTIDAIQHQIIQEFAMLGQERELLLNYIIELGESMPPFPEKYKTSTYLLPGCLSKVWLLQRVEAGRIHLEADSNAAMTKGLISLLVRIFSAQPISAIARAHLFFIEETNLVALLGIQRRSGFEQMIKRIQGYAQHLLSKEPAFGEK